MGIASQYILIFEDGRADRLALGIVNLTHAGRHIAQELCVVELMPAVAPVVKSELAVA